MRPPGKQGDKSARIPELGDKVSEGQALFTVGAERPLGVRATVDEVAVRRVRPGQRALVSGPALGERALEGRVRSVAPQASREGQLPVFPVRIALEDLAPERARLLRLGMSASVRIVVREEKDAVLVPVVAVKRRDGGEAVRVPGPEGPVWRQVTTGLSDAEFIQVTEGLAAGQKVLY
jgi:multidrug efflux pump subunit AcrA (membrane-fusion protein)